VRLLEGGGLLAVRLLEGGDLLAVLLLEGGDFLVVLLLEGGDFLVEDVAAVCFGPIPSPFNVDGSLCLSTLCSPVRDRKAEGEPREALRCRVLLLDPIGQTAVLVLEIADIFVS
jgi:hypothetical protein